MKLFGISDVISYFDGIAKQFNHNPIRLWFGPQVVIFIADAENAEIILKSKDCLNRPHIFLKVIQNALEVDGLFTSKGMRIIFLFNERRYSKYIVCLLLAEEWKFHRRLVGATINKPSVHAHLSTFNDNIRRSVKRLPRNHFFDLLEEVNVCKISMFVDAALGSQLKPHIKQKYLTQFAE